MPIKVVITMLIICFSMFYSFSDRSDHEIIEFMESLEDDQLEKVMFSMDDIYRERWHYLPATDWARPGINLEGMTEDQKSKFHILLKKYLSESGYEKTMATIDLENVLAELENNPKRRNPENYYVAIYGDPEEDDVWAWRFEGHHISLHFTTVDDKVSMSPRFFGANPAIVKSGSRKGLKSLEVEQSLGLQLINSLDRDQKEEAIIQEASYWEIATSNAVEVAPFAKRGIKYEDLERDQQKLLMDIITEYISSIPEDLAEERMESILEEDQDEIIFAWAGSTTLGEEHYYRIQGESFLIEFDNAQNNANHIHTVWRDFDGDFGRDLIREHREEHHH